MDGNAVPGPAVRAIAQKFGESRGLPVKVQVLRAGHESIQLEIETPREGGLGLGLRPRILREYAKRTPPSEALARTNAGFIRLCNLIRSQFLGAIEQPSEARLSGPVGIAKMGNEYAEAGGLYGVLLFAALLNINLAAVNALPIPGLDGGQLAFLLIETAAGKRLNRKLLAGINVAFQLSLFALALSVFGSEIGKSLGDLIAASSAMEGVSGVGGR
mmetsp:Transcript_2591/g.3943  ORF Transcript_2591/g.3943 Transcript_2591/m.3943 type:complete len:216 (-) Transcript_2591:173-820(-)